MPAGFVYTNIVQFTNVAPAAIVALPHGLIANSVPRQPDICIRSNGNFTVISATTTTVTVQNNGPGVDSLDLWCQWIYSVDRAFLPVGADQLPVVPFIPDAGGSVASVVGVSNCLIYQPGGPSNGPGTFNSWPSLMAQLGVFRANASNEGCYTIQFDDSFTSPAVIPAGGPYDMTDVTWEGLNKNLGGLVQIADGASFIGLRKFANNIQVLNANTVTPAVADLANFDIIELRSTDLSTVGGGAAFFSGPSLGGGDLVIVRMVDSSTTGFNGVGPVFNFSVAGSFLFIITQDSSILLPATLVGAVGALLQIAVESMQQIPTTFANWAGTILAPRLDTPMSLLPKPYRAAPSAAAQAPATFNWVRYTTAGGPITDTLPSISGNYADPGGFLLATNYSTGVLTMNPAGGNTLNGGATGVTVSPNGSMMFVSDGVSDWRTISQWGNNRFSPPEQWALQDIAANLTNQALSAQVSTDFDNIPMIRAGSIVGLNTRFTEAITTGTATVTVTVNGSAGTLSVVSTSVSNSTGGRSTQRAGIDTFAAGGLVGIQITTDGTFAPTTTDIESWLEIEEIP